MAGRGAGPGGRRLLLALALALALPAPPGARAQLPFLIPGDPLAAAGLAGAGLAGWQVLDWFGRTPEGWTEWTWGFDAGGGGGAYPYPYAGLDDFREPGGGAGAEAAAGGAEATAGGEEAAAATTPAARGAAAGPAGLCRELRLGGAVSLNAPEPFRVPEGARLRAEMEVPAAGAHCLQVTLEGRRDPADGVDGVPYVIKSAGPLRWGAELGDGFREVEVDLAGVAGEALWDVIAFGYATTVAKAYDGALDANATAGEFLQEFVAPDRCRAAEAPETLALCVRSAEVVLE